MNLPDTKKKLDHVLGASGRATELVKQILSFSGNPKGDFKPVSPSVITKEVLKLMRASLPSTIEIKQSFNSSRYVIADETNIHQVLMNLCTNAGHAMKRTGGELNVILDDVVLSERDITHQIGIIPGKYIKITIQDNGHGMAKEVQKKAFDPFYSTKRHGEGTGMGLAAVHGIISELGGFVTLESEPYKGTAVNVFIPSISKPVATKPCLKTELPKGGTERILFVDDEKIQIEIAVEALSSHGYDVTSFSDSEKAWHHFQQNVNDYDLVITDMTMPKMTGDILARNIRSKRPDIPIVICTGFSEAMDEPKALSSGIKAFLYKPVNIKKLLKTIREILDNIICQRKGSNLQSNTKTIMSTSEMDI